MRKWDQHLNNFAFVGETPGCVDHDVIGPPATFPHSPSGYGDGKDTRGHDHGDKRNRVEQL